MNTYDVMRFEEQIAKRFNEILPSCTEDEQFLITEQLGNKSHMIPEVASMHGVLRPYPLRALYLYMVAKGYMQADNYNVNLRAENYYEDCIETLELIA